ncbi:MAG: DNA repair protein RecO [Ginsengibacter sp.]
MVYNTQGIVLRTVKYGETSVVVSIFTEMFGIQSYMVNGVRTTGKNTKAQYFQPSALLDLQVYHNELKSLQRIKDVKWSLLFTNIFSDIFKNAVAIFAVELLTKSLRQPEVNDDLFHFCVDFLQELDKSNQAITANLSLYFAIHLTSFLGLKIEDNYAGANSNFDYKEGKFTSQNNNEVIADEITNFQFAELLKTLQPGDLNQVKLNRQRRVVLLNTLEKYYAWHMNDFGKMKSLTILQQLF